MGSFSRSIKRSLRQLVSFVVAGVAAYGAWTYSRDAGLFHAFQGGTDLWPIVAGVVAFFVAFWAMMTFISGKAAR